MAKRKTSSSTSPGRCIAYPMARLEGSRSPEEDHEMFFQKLAAWATNPKILGVWPTGNGWFMAKVEVDAPPSNEPTEEELGE